jgi:excisionase family DNA binding protein
MTMITTATAAQRLGISPRRVRVLIDTGRLPAARIGRDHLIREQDLALVAVRRPGRPKRVHEAAPSQ